MKAIVKEVECGKWLLDMGCVSCYLFFFINFQKKEKKKKDHEIITYNIETPKGAKKGNILLKNVISIF